MRQPAADCLAVGFMSMPRHLPMDTKRTWPPRNIIDLYTAYSWFSKAFGDAGVISDEISHGDFNRIGLLYRYERRPSNIVEFCSYCWKMAKNAPFDTKSPVKNFPGRAREKGHRTVALS